MDCRIGTTFGAEEVKKFDLYDVEDDTVAVDHLFLALLLCRDLVQCLLNVFPLLTNLPRQPMMPSTLPVA